jgi:hypothetical protein
VEWSFFLEEAVFLEASYQSRRHGMYHSSFIILLDSSNVVRELGLL